MSYSTTMPSSSFSHSINPIPDLFNNSKLNLDMSFNRNPQGTFESDVDPFSLELFPMPAPTPTFEDFEPTEEELFGALLEWKFPIRSDCARGLIWGPFRHLRGNSWTSDVDASPYDPHPMDPFNQQDYSSDPIPDIPVTQHLSEPFEHLSENTEYQPQTTEHLPQPSTQLPQAQQPSFRLQRIFPILRSPIVIRIKPVSLSSSPGCSSTKRRRQSSRQDSFKSSPSASPKIMHLGIKTPQPKKQKFVQVALSLPFQPIDTSGQSRIKLCATSRLKYGN